MADQPEDHDRQVVVVAHEERRRAELPERAAKAKPAAARLQTPAGRRRAARAGEAPSGGGLAKAIPPDSTGTRTRTTSGRRPAPGRSMRRGESRKSSGGLPRVIRKPKPSVTAETPSAHEHAVEYAAEPSLRAGARPPGDHGRDGQAQQERHPGGVDGDAQGVHDRIGDGDEQGLWEPASGGPGSWRGLHAPSARRRRPRDAIVRPPGRGAPVAARAGGRGLRSRAWDRETVGPAYAARERPRPGGP